MEFFTISLNFEENLTEFRVFQQQPVAQLVVIMFLTMNQENSGI